MEREKIPFHAIQVLQRGLDLNAIKRIKYSLAELLAVKRAHIQCGLVRIDQEQHCLTSSDGVKGLSGR
jgi:hypothetical protein